MRKQPIHRESEDFMTTETLRIGMIGLDTSHALAYTELLHDRTHPYHVPGGRIAAAYPGGSADFELSRSRVQGFTEKLRDSHGVRIVDSPRAAVIDCDAVLLTSVDGRVHLEQFKEIAAFGKPVFIDKPFAVTSAHAREIADLAERAGVPFMSSSALRYAEELAAALGEQEDGDIIGIDSYGPLELQPTQPGLFWYGIHTVEMLYAVLGKGCLRVSAVSNEDHDLIAGEWPDGTIGTVRGNRRGNNKFGALLHRTNGSRFIDVYRHPKPFYASLLEKIMPFFATGRPDIDPEETLGVIRFIEAANESRQTGKPVTL